MKKAVYTVFLIDCVYILTLSVASLFSNNYTLYLLFRYIALILPLVALIFVARRDELRDKRILPKKDGALMTLPLIAPTILAVIGISYVTALLLNPVLGAPKAGAEIAGGGEFLLHALIPSFFEELVFRFVPLVLLAPHSKRGAIVISSLLFAFVHFNPYQIPYALVAGAIYMAADLAFNSPLPGIAMHLLNNVTALLWQREGFAPIVLTVLALLTVVSAIAVILARKQYKRAFSFFLDKGDREEIPVLPVLLVAVSFIVAFVTYVGC